MDYVVGFMREALSGRVLMVRKSKPAWQSGLLNGVGGKVDHRVPIVANPDPGEAGQAMAKLLGDRLETPLEAMVREFEEETGIQTDPSEWRLIMYMADPRDFYADDGGTVYWFACERRFLPKVPPRVLDSGEELTTIRVSEVLQRDDVLATVRWAIPMAFMDPTLAVLGSDDAVLANGRAATRVPPVRKLIAEHVAANRAKPPNSAGEIRNRARIRETDEKLAKLADGVLAPDERFPDPERGIEVGDHVSNKAGTEAGRVLALDEGTAWVRSTQYPNKRITLKVEDLKPDFLGHIIGAGSVYINGERIVDVANLTIPEEIRRQTEFACGGRIIGDGERAGIVLVDGQYRKHNGVSLGDVVAIDLHIAADKPLPMSAHKMSPEMFGKFMARVRDRARFDHMRPRKVQTKTCAVPPDATQRAMDLEIQDQRGWPCGPVPHEPLAMPDAPHVMCDDTGAGAQEQFGLPSMQEQKSH